MTSRIELRLRPLSCWVLWLLVGGCFAEVPSDGTDSIGETAGVPVSEAPPATVAPTPVVVEPEDGARNLPFPETRRDPALYAYATDMAADGWSFASRSSDDDGPRLRARHTDPDDPPPDEPDPRAYEVEHISSSFRSVTVKPRCIGNVQLHRSIAGGAFASLGSVPCNRNYADATLEPGTPACYAVRPTSSKPLSAPACTRTRYEPYQFNELSHSHASSEAMMERYDWRHTEAISAGQPGAPNLWYMSILSDHAYDLHALRALGIHTQTTPLFAEEQAVWQPSDDIVEVDGQLVGQWIYAIVPGPVYNDMRAQMIAQVQAGHTPGFRALVFRSLPVSAAREWLDVGAYPSPIKAEYVGTMGVEYNGYSSCRDGLCQTQQELLGWLARKVYDVVADFVDGVVEGVRQLIGAWVRMVKGEVTLTLLFKLMNTDTKFGTSNEVWSAWRNAPVVLRNTRVQVGQSLALFKANTDTNGIAQLRVAKGWSGKICLELENDRVSFTNGWAESTACVQSFSGLTADTTMIVNVNDEKVNAFATMTDASEYVSTVMGHNMPRVKVLIGWAAEHAGGEDDQSFAPCLGMSPVLISSLLDLGLATLMPHVAVAAALVESFYSVDIILKDDALATRGVPTHEYGHTVMCSMMRNADPANADLALLDILSGYMVGERKDVDKQQTYMAEALADFIALQVVGGTNYVSPADGLFTDSGRLSYCHAGSQCFEQNVQPAADDWYGQLRRTISILQDAFDDTRTSTATPNDGSHWRYSLSFSTLLPDVRVDSNRNDEPFELAGSDMRQIYERWADRGKTLREPSFFGALGELLLERGYSHRDVCTMFESHDSSRACPAYIQELENFCPPFDPANLSASFCRAGCCSLGEGDCDSDAECAPGLYCASSGPLFGLPADYDVCTQDETLTVVLVKPSGTSLTVSADRGNLSCTFGTCTTGVQHNDTVVLTASRAVTWSGCAVLSSTQCRTQMTQGRSVTATASGPNQPDPGDEPDLCQRRPNLPQCRLRSP